MAWLVDGSMPPTPGFGVTHMCEVGFHRDRGHTAAIALFANPSAGLTLFNDVSMTAMKPNTNCGHPGFLPHQAGQSKLGPSLIILSALKSFTVCCVVFSLRSDLSVAHSCWQMRHYCKGFRKLEGTLRLQGGPASQRLFPIQQIPAWLPPPPGGDPLK